jgi:hypothetical protein
MPYQDRSLGLIIFGVLTILLGCAIGGLGLLMLVAQSLVPEDQRIGSAALIPNLSMYAVLAVALIVLGIGSIMAKRWARALLLIFSWSWLVVGVMDTLVCAVILPSSIAASQAQLAAQTGKAAPPTAVITDVVLIFTFGILAVIFVLMPGIWTFFYYSPHVKATCDARDPNPSWTDACPLPVLAISLWLWLCVPMMLLMPFSGHPAMPLFGLLLTGLPASLVSICFAGLWGFGGWLLFRVDIRGWWLIVLTLVLVTISSVITFSLHPMVDFYRAMDYPQKQIDAIQKIGIFNGSAFAWIMGAIMLPFLGYLIFVRRYFVRPMR